MVSKSVLIVEDEPMLRKSLALLLSESGFESLQAADGQEAYNLVLQRPVDVVLSDIRMPNMDGLALLDHLRRLAPQTPVIIITGYGTIETAVSAIRAGACDYLLKPMRFDDVLNRVRRAIDFQDLSRSHQVTVDQLAADSTFHNLIGESPAMTKLFDLVRKLSTVSSNVLIMGESGTGKELFARAIHYNGITRNKPFLGVNCGAIPEELMESHFFGHRKGAFTGAVMDKVGYFAAASGGTLFLDEISAMPLNLQAALLRPLEERVVVPIGDTHPRPVDCRVIAASNRNLPEMVQRGEFREDLLFRLDVVHFTLPPLRERRGDIPLLVGYFLHTYCERLNKAFPGITNGAMRALINHSWPGNVRELENAVERAVIFAEGRPIRVEDLPFAISKQEPMPEDDLRDALRQFEKQHIICCLQRHQNDKAAAAKSLGIAVSSLYHKLRLIGLDDSPDDIETPVKP